MNKVEIERMQRELQKILMDKSEEEINDGSPEAFCDGVSSGFYDAAAIVWNYFQEKLKERNT